jgi:hypothetical protein
MAARVLHNLINYELRVPPHVEALDAQLNGDFEAAEKGLVFSHIVGRGEVKVHRAAHVLPKG